MNDARDAELLAALGPFVDDARAGLRAQIDATLPVPDLQDVVERAHRIDPVATPEAFVIASRDPALLPDPDLDLDAAEPGPQWTGFVSGAVAEIESWGAQRRMAPAPPAAPVPRRRFRTLGVAVGLAAAAAVVAFALGALSSREVTADASEDRTQAPMASEATRTSEVEASTRRADHPRKPRPSRPGRDESSAPEEVLDDEVDADDAPEQLAGDTTDPPRTRPPAKAQTESLADLDVRAQALWRDGDESGAAKLFEEIGRHGGKSTYAELAFGDLFSIAHRKYGRRKQTQLWRRYLARFPKGRYADDASASLCRADGSEACWDAYLRDWPNGVHRAEAKRARSP